MFHAVRIKNIWVTVFSLTGVLLFVAVCLIALRAGAPETVEINGEPYPLCVEDDADVEAFLAACGYEAPELIWEHEITVPKNWNETYENYNELQRSQGFDLVPYKGKKAQERVYFADEGVSMTLLICDNTIIAAHIADCDGKEMRAVIR